MQPVRAQPDDHRFVAAWERFSRSLRRRRGREAQSGGPGLSIAQYQLCESLRNGPLPVGAAAVVAGIAPPTATRMIDLLVTQGLVERGSDPSDRRVVTVALTPAGRRALLRKDVDVAGFRARVAAALTDEERAVAADILVRLADVVDEL